MVALGASSQPFARYVTVPGRGDKISRDGGVKRMPKYDYICPDCGPFEEWRSMSLSAEPVACTSCGRGSSRAISAPFISNMNPYNRVAHQRNEKSADQPMVINKKDGDHGAHGPSHHGHAHAHNHKVGGHKHGPSRPWMIGH